MFQLSSADPEPPELFSISVSNDGLMDGATSSLLLAEP